MAKRRKLKSKEESLYSELLENLVVTSVAYAEKGLDRDAVLTALMYAANLAASASELDRGAKGDDALLSGFCVLFDEWLVSDGEGWPELMDAGLTTAWSK